MPRVPLSLEANGYRIETSALVDSGAMINVMPFDMGKQLGMVWNERQATISLGGITRGSDAMPILVSVQIGNYKPVELIFAWARRVDIPLILGQVDFFRHFQVCFEGYALEFEIKPKRKK